MKDVDTLKGLHGLRTMFSAKKRSMPRVQSSGYLELYMLGKEKERILKEDERLDIRKDALKKRLGEIDMEINKLREAPQSEIKSAPNAGFSGGTFTQKNGVKKVWKKMSLNY